MRGGLFAKLALNNIKKNYRFYIPHILTGTGLLGAYYIVFTLMKDKRLGDVRGGEYLSFTMEIGTVVMALLSFILILYTNSFLMRQRKREYGLYNVLGMEKKHVIKVMFMENFFSSSCSLFLGTALGIGLYKLCSLLICALFQTDIVLGFYFISMKTIVPSILFFVALYVLSFIVNVISICKLKPVELLSSKATGEKEPRVKWPILIIGILCLGVGYFIAVTTKSPLAALILFFVAVFLVIIGTYFTFTAGSIFALKALKNNKKYYYNKKHFSTVSGLIYRMKQNAVGLASVCLLSTGVIVMISSTVSLYSGMQESLDSSYPEQLYVSADYYTLDGECVPVNGDELKEVIKKAAETAGTSVKSAIYQRYLSVTFVLENGKLSATPSDGTEMSKDALQINFMTEEMYGQLTGEKHDISGNEIIICKTKSTTEKLLELIGSEIVLGGETYPIMGIDSSFPIDNMSTILNGVGVVVADDNALDKIYQAQSELYGRYRSEYENRLAVDFTDENFDNGDTLSDAFYTEIQSLVSGKENSGGGIHISFDSAWEARDSVIGMYGTFLFLGIILGTVCLFAAVLIIFYKQISEGYEDRERYQIMKKVGMSDGEIKMTIRSQTLLVFFLPLGVAGVHMAFAFPIIDKLLHVLLLSKTSLFIACTVITYLIFALVYVLIYLRTAKTYYKIVR